MLICKSTLNSIKYLVLTVLFNGFYVSYGQTACNTSANTKANALLMHAFSLNNDGETGSIKLLKQAIDMDTTFAQAYFLLGEIHYKKALLSQYDIQNQSYTAYYFSKSVEYFKAAIAQCEEVNNYAAHFYLGEYYYFQKEYAQALKYLTNYKNHKRSDGIETAQRYIDNCKQWLHWNENQAEVTIAPLHEVCTASDEFSPFVTAYGQVLYFTRKYIKPAPNTMYDSEINELTYSLVSSIDTLGNWVYTPGKKLEYPFNSGIIYDAVSTNPANNEMYLTVSAKQKADNKYIKIGSLYYTKKSSNYWDEPELLNQYINYPNCYNGQASVSRDGNLLIFVSDRPGGMGGTDLYYCLKDNNNQWQNPENMGPVVNTRNNETSPFLHYDSKTLYFASDGHFGMGARDIFITRKVDSQWIAPKNLGTPINTTADESDFIIDAGGKSGYLASTGFTGEGGRDIFRADIPKEFRPEEMVILNGIVTGTDSVPLKYFNLKFTKLTGNESIEPIIDFKTGSFAAILPQAIKGCYLQISAKGFSFGNCFLQTTHNSSTLFVNCRLTPLKRGNSFFLHHMYFGPNLELLPESMQIITDFTHFMQTNPALKINVWAVNVNNLYAIENNTLGTKAQKIYSNLLQNGINDKRLSYSADTLGIKKLPDFNPTQSEILIEVSGY